MKLTLRKKIDLGLVGLMWLLTIMKTIKTGSVLLGWIMVNIFATYIIIDQKIKK